MRTPSILLLILTLSILPLLSMSQPQIAYYLSWSEPETHTLHIRVEAPANGQGYTDFQLPRWRPGRYILQDYAAAVSNVRGLKGDTPLQVEKIDNSRWRVHHPSKTGKISIEYDYYANVTDAGSSVYNNEMVYVNPVNCMMYVPQMIDEPVELYATTRDKSLKVASQLQQDPENHQHFLADSYHDLADSPTIFSENITQFSFEQDGVTYRLNFAGNYGAEPGDEDALIEMLRPTIREQAAVFGGVPAEVKTYDFIYLLVPFFYRHAVEHKNSSMYVLPEGVAASAESFRGLIGISSHEFWHTWNVKRLRPKAMVPYDYATPQHTTLHWLTEGVTDYYAYLTLCRAGVYSQEEFFDYCSRIMTSLENNYAQGIISPAQSSWDSWLATSPYQPSHHRISYYTLGSRLGLLLDLTLRHRTNGTASMDEVFHELYQQHYQQGHGYTEDDVLAVMNALIQSAPNSDIGGFDPYLMDEFYNDYIDGTKAVDYDRILKPMGLEVQVDTAQSSWADWLGITRLQDVPDGEGQLVRSLHYKGDGAQNGLAVRDMILTINGKDVNDDTAMGQLQFTQGDTLQLVFMRNGTKEARTFKLTGNALPTTYKLQAADDGLNELAEDWLKARAN